MYNVITLSDSQLNEACANLKGKINASGYAFDVVISIAQGGIRVGTVGILNYYKGSELYPEIALALSNVPNLNFYAIGNIQCNGKVLADAGIDINGCNSTHIPDHEFIQRVKQLDYLLFLYPSDTYKLIASGAILDSIRFHRPIIGLSTDYFKYIFEKFGKLGFLADNVDELINILRQLPCIETPDIDFDKIGQKLSKSALLPAFKEIMENCNSKAS